ETANTPYTNLLKKGQVVRIPIGHGDGNFFADAETLKRIEDNDQVVFRYIENPNGSLHDIAGIVNDKRNVLGMMPHPDRSSESILGSADGKLIFESMVNALVSKRALNFCRDKHGIRRTPDSTQSDGSRIPEDRGHSQTRTHAD